MSANETIKGLREKYKLVYGLGKNDANYQVHKYIYIVDEDGKQKQKLVWICPFYRKWKDMLRRCYSDKYQEKQPTYKGCSVCEEWLTFSNFRAWMEKQDWKGKELDKDILFPGNKIYNPETCVFVDQRVNKFLNERGASRGEYMIGVNWDKNSRKFRSLCNEGEGKQKHLGLFGTEIEAHKSWLEYKLKVAQQLASEQTDPRIAKALIDRYAAYNAN